MAEEVAGETEPTMPPMPQTQTQLLKYLLFTLVGLLLLGGTIYAGYWYGTESAKLPPEADRPLVDKTQIQETPTPTPTPTPILVPLPTIDPTASWETYTNNEYKFSLKYPNNKQVEIDTINPYMGICNLGKAVVALKIYSLGFQKPPIETEFSGELVVTIDVEQNPAGLSIEDWIGRNCSGTWLSNARKEIVNVAGIKTTKFIGTGELMGRPKMIIFSRSNLLYFIYPYGEEQLFDQILATFKFLD